MTEQVNPALFNKSGLSQEGSGQDAWRILETRFGCGRHFLTTWLAWKNDPARSHMLHYVSLTNAPPQWRDLLASAALYPALLPLTQELAPHWFGLLPGFHRFSLDGGRVLLTLCVGDLTALLRQQQFVADLVHLNPEPTLRPAQTPVSGWDVWAIKALARCCRRGTLLVTTAEATDFHADLKQGGFELQTHQTDPTTGFVHGQFNPRWSIKNARDTFISPAATVGTCAVIGAGLAGASVAAALAKRGWQVQVLDQGVAPAAGASGLPVGLVVPHVSADDCPLSRLSRSGVRMTLQEAQRLLQKGQDWDPTGVLERRVDGTPGLPANWPAPGQDWSQTTPFQVANAAWNQGIATDQPAIWHRQAAWLKPAQLIKAWLEQPGVTFQGQARVAALRQNGDEWELLNEQGEVLAHANRVVFANASGAQALIESVQTALPALNICVKQLSGMHGLLGQLSWALHSDSPNAAFPPFPVNGSGSVVPAVPLHGGMAWYIGSSYQLASKPALADDKNHAANLGRLNKLLPRLGQMLAAQFDAGPINAWKQTRCVTADRLPLVGPLYKAEQPSLWMCAGMGSRGMSFSVLCAELLAARWGAEPLAVDAGLAHSLDALRGSTAAR